MAVLSSAFSRKEKNGPGLEKKFAVGEEFPWKGICFRVSKVDHKKIELSPVGLTWQMAKRIRAIQTKQGGR